MVAAVKQNENKSRSRGPAKKKKRRKKKDDQSFTTVYADPAECYPGRWQVRRKFSQPSLDDLGASMAANGQMLPILVREMKRNGREKYEIVAGERRWRAGKIAIKIRGTKVKKLELRILPPDADFLILSLSENIQRAALTPMEEAEGIQKLMKERDMSQRQAADALGLKQAYVSASLSLLKLPEVLQTKIHTGEYSKQVGIVLVREMGEHFGPEMVRICKRMESEGIAITAKNVQARCEAYWAAQSSGGGGSGNRNKGERGEFVTELFGLTEPLLEFTTAFLGRADGRKALTDEIANLSGSDKKKLRAMMEKLRTHSVNLHTRIGELI